MRIAIIAGSAECLWKDVERFKEILEPGTVVDVACINHTALHWPRAFQYWITWHTDLFTDLKDQMKHTPITIGPDDTADVDMLVSFTGFMATDSSLYAVKVLLDLGFDRVVLCGVPIDNSRKFYDKPEDELPQWDSSNIQHAWLQESKSFNGKVRSMSGNTRGMFGEPTKEWLCS